MEKFFDQYGTMLLIILGVIVAYQLYFKTRDEEESAYRRAAMATRETKCVSASDCFAICGRGCIASCSGGKCKCDCS